MHRKLDNNVVLQVAESSITLGDWFHISTNPELPNMDLQWIIPMEFQIISTGLNGRDDQPVIRKKVTSKNPSTITVTDKYCGGSVSTEVTVLDK